MNKVMFQNLKKKFETVRNQTEDGDIMLTGVLESPHLDETLLALKQSAGNPVTVSINSYGGDASVGMAIYNALSNYDGDVTTTNYGVAASAAGVAFLAGDIRQAYPSSLLMLHNAWTIGMGNSQDFANISANLATLDKQLLNIAGEISGNSEEDLRELFAKDELLDSETALRMGYNTAIITPEPEEKDKLAEACLTFSQKSGITDDSFSKTLELFLGGK